MMLTLSGLLLLAGLSSAAVQTIGARGQLMCGDKPIDNTEVKLWATHTWPRPDSNLATVKTDSQGRFNVSGTESSIFTLTPEVRLYHRCNNKGILSIPNLCQRKVTYKIPDSYIAKSGTVQKWYEMGTMNMEAKQKGEGGHCVDNPIRSIG
ncbi:hypothetical protein PFISCL1PPCAC_13090, partial [Pristionchus fissidentatus]